MDNRYKSPTEENISAAARHERAVQVLSKHETTAASIAAWRANRQARAEKSSPSVDEDKPGRWPVLEAMREAGRAPAQIPGARKDRSGRGR